jgi:uncharacterized membrane protein (DUF106 family)
MSLVNAALRPIFDLALAPFSGLPPIVSLVIVSLLTAVFMLIVFKRTSNQPALADVKRRIHAGLFEIRLFNDDLRAILRAQGEILRTNLTYLKLSLVPMVWILPPLVLLIAQLQFHYGYEGLSPTGKSTLLTVELKPEAVSPEARPRARLDLPPGIGAETDDVWIPAESQLVWRLAPEREGDYEVGVSVDGSPAVTKTVRVTDRTVRLSPIRVAPDFLSELIYPAEPPLPAEGPIQAIHVDYPDRDVSVLGFGMHWLIPFFVLSIAFAFALRGRMKVTI